MKFSLPAAVAARALFLVTLLVASGATPAAVGNAAVGRLFISSAWARATPAGVGVGAAYFTIVNRGSRPDTLLSITSPAAAMVELHQTSMESGLSRMRPAGEIAIDPGQTVNVAPGGLHAMLMGLKTPLVAGTSVPLVLHFRQAGAITVQMGVQPLTSMSHQGHSGH